MSLIKEDEVDFKFARFGSLEKLIEPDIIYSRLLNADSDYGTLNGNYSACDSWDGLQNEPANEPVLRKETNPISIRVRSIKWNIFLSIIILHFSLIGQCSYFFYEKYCQLDDPEIPGFLPPVLLFLISTNILCLVFNTVSLMFLSIVRDFLCPLFRPRFFLNFVFAIEILTFGNSFVFGIFWIVIKLMILGGGYEGIVDFFEFMANGLADLHVQMMGLSSCVLLFPIVREYFFVPSKSKVVLSRLHVYLIILALLFIEIPITTYCMVLFVVKILAAIKLGFLIHGLESIWELLIVVLGTLNVFVILYLTVIAWRWDCLNKRNIVLIKFAYWNIFGQFLLCLIVLIMDLFLRLFSTEKVKRQIVPGHFSVVLAWLVTIISAMLLYNFVDFELLQRHILKRKNVKTPLIIEMSCKCCEITL